MATINELLAGDGRLTEDRVKTVDMEDPIVAYQAMRMEGLRSSRVHTQHLIWGIKVEGVVHMEALPEVVHILLVPTEVGEVLQLAVVDSNSGIFSDNLDMPHFE